jgi:hypothetical protein
MTSCFSLHAQRSVGVKWEMPENQKAAMSQLQQYHELGISIIEVQSPLSSPVWREINRLEFEVYGNLGIRFPTTSTFSEPDSSLINSIQNKASAYLSQSSVTSINLFEYGAIHNSPFFKALEPIARQLKSRRQTDLYFTSRRLSTQDISSSDFIMWDLFVTSKNIDTLSIPQGSTIGAYIYSPSEDLYGYLTPFKKFLDLTSSTSEKPIFIYQDWLNSTLAKYPDFPKTLRSVISKPDPVFPLPKESIPNGPASVLPILMLLLIWGTVALHFNSSPLYRKSLFRYFTAHKFFIQDIFQRHIRSPFPALLIILQNVFLLSTCVFATYSAVLSPLAKEALIYHFPLLSTFGNSPLSIFIWTIILTLAISFLSIMWLYLGHKRISSLTQTTTIYAWPQQLNILLGTLVITLFSADASHTLIVIFTVFAVLIFILSFLLTSIDTARFAKSKILHQIKTSGLYLAVWGSFIGWILTNEQWMDIINLALDLR